MVLIINPCALYDFGTVFRLLRSAWCILYYTNVDFCLQPLKRLNGGFTHFQHPVYIVHAEYTVYADPTKTKRICYCYKFTA